MMFESDHVIALVLIKVGFLVSSKTMVRNYSSNQKQLSRALMLINANKFE